MTTQPETAVGNEAIAPELTPEQKFEALAREEFGIQDEEEQPAEGDLAEGAEDDPTLEEEADDLPPIDAPVSWDAEAKELFKALPRDAQEIVAKREGERERFVQQKSQEAARARTDAAQEASQQLAQIEAGYAQHYQALAEGMTAQRPNPVLLDSNSPHYNPQAFYAQQAQFENTVAQQRELQQLASQHAQQAQVRAQQAEQASHAEQHRIIVDQFPEYANPTTGPELQRKLTAVAKELGYSDELIGQARASDILAMRTAADWKAKAEKYDALQANKMAKVRAAKGLPKVATPGVATNNSQARNIQAAEQTLLTSKNRDEQGAAFLRILETKGW